MFLSNEQYVVDSNGSKVAVIIDLDTFRKFEEEYDDMASLLGYNQVKESVDAELAAGQYSTFDDFEKVILK